MITNRYTKVYKRLLPGYHCTKPTTFVGDFDCTNLYGPAMIQFLSREEIEAINFTDIPDDNKTGNILQVDLHYLDHLHDLHSDYPLAPEIKLIDDNMISPFAISLVRTRPTIKKN